MTTLNDSAGEIEPAGASAGPSLEEVTADRDRWKALSRQNETNYNATRTELQQLQAAQESALETARTEGRTAALGEVSKDLVTAELQLQALKAGTELPDLGYLDMSQFAGDDSRPNPEAVATFVASLKPRSTAPVLPRIGGALPNRGDSGSGFTSTDPSALADYIAGGAFL
ncbi:hypothetical protein ABT160_04625 [Streptomyces sp. NPDC001941]|uniref:hypothetical protein n=1 Tax=Streptomyces sp. NPDC001941 TaxID=3154659 RepID=UPI0033334CAE